MNRTHLFGSLLFITIAFFSLLIPLSVTLATTTAATTTNSNGLIPCGNEPDANVAARSCDFAAFIRLISNVMNFAVILSIPISTITFVAVGFLFLTAQGNPNKITRAKQIAWKMLIGFIVILSAWVIIHVISSSLLKPQFNIFMQTTP